MVRNSKGLTLVELMVVLAIVGIMTAMAIPMLGITPEAKLKSAARDIVSNMQAVRMNALRDGKNWRVEFDTGNKQYKVYAFDPAQPKDKEYVLQKTVPLYDGSAAARFAFGSGYGPVPDLADPVDGISFPGNHATFKSDGSLSAGGAVYVMDTKTKDTIAISVVFTTGRIHMRTNFGGGWSK